MIGYWFKSSILSILFIPFVSLANTNTNTNKYTLNIVSTNTIIRTLHIEQQPVKVKEVQFPLDITDLVNTHTNQPQFGLQFNYDEIDKGDLIINVEVYKNNNLIAGYGYENKAVLKNTNRLRCVNIFIIDK